MSTLLWIVIVIVAVLLIGAIAASLARRRRTAQLREGFGPEYERTLERSFEELAAPARRVLDEHEATSRPLGGAAILPIHPPTRRQEHFHGVGRGRETAAEEGGAVLLRDRVQLR